MTMRLLLILLLAAFSCSAHAADWDAGDKALFGAFAVLQIIDGVQTAKCVRTDWCHEANPLYGSHPNNATIIGIKGAFTAGAYLAADAMPSEWQRKGFLGAISLISAGVVLHNHAVGVRIGGAF